MGIRVDKDVLMKQLEIRKELHKTEQIFHQKLLKDQLPLTIGGGIGQSRLCMMLLRKAHIGEVPGLKEYAEFFVSEEIAGPDGPLAAYGIVSDPALADTQSAVANEATMGSGS